MASRDGRRAVRCRALGVALLLAGPLLVGCLTDPSSRLEARQGDLARLDLVVANDTVVWPPAKAGATSSALCGAELSALGAQGCPQARGAYVLSGDRPAHLPEGFENASALPSRLVEVVEGLPEDGHRWAPEVQAWGPHREELVRDHDRRDRVPRIVEDATAYGRTWNASHLENGSVRLEPSADERGTRLEISEWCNQRFCLFTSELVNWTSTHLVVEHHAREGDRVHVRELDTFLTVTQANRTHFTIDGNDPRAGETFEVYAHVVDLRGPPQGERRAPPFELSTVDGDRVRLADLLSKPVVIEFFATWCPSCRENAEHLAKVQDRFGDRVNIVSIAVDPWESSKALNAFIEEHNVTWPVAVDEQGEVSRDYSVGTLSTEVIVGPEGAIRHVETGVADHDRVVALLADLSRASSEKGEPP